MGLDGRDLLATADEATAVLGPDTPVTEHVACQLGALMAVAAQHGRDHLTFLIDDRFSSFGLWIEQLIAESTGKHGVGILPVVGEPADAPDPDTRLYVVIGDGAAAGALPGPSVHLAVEEPEDLGAQVFLWEFATAVAGIVLGINPFDQPDVESAKLAARTVLAGGSAAATPDESSLDDALDRVREGDAIVVAAFVDPALEPERNVPARPRSPAGAATTLGLGPRFLHSTGQLHKGGADRIVMIQAVGDDPTDVPVPGETFTFAQLKQAQADGDFAAVADSGKRVVRVPLDELLAAGNG